MKTINIYIAGNSVALRIRPPQVSPQNVNYTALLRKMLNEKNDSILFRIENGAFGASTIRNIHENIETCIQSFSDVYIINIGVVDSCNRDVPLWFYRLANRKSEDMISVFFRGIYRNILAKMRPFLVTIRGRRPWLSRRKFRIYYNLVLEALIKETNAQIIILPINLGNERIEKELPGSRRNHQRYNEILKGLSQKHGVRFIDLSHLDSARHYPDGIHYNVEGHQEIADSLYREITDMLRLS